MGVALGGPVRDFFSRAVRWWSPRGEGVFFGGVPWRVLWGHPLREFPRGFLDGTPGIPRGVLGGIPNVYAWGTPPFGNRLNLGTPVLQGAGGVRNE